MNNNPNLFSKHANKNYDKWRAYIPALQFPPQWKITMLPPFGGAVVRFAVEENSAHVSIYLDCYDALGCVGRAYWEVYPHNDNVTCRCLMDKTDELISAIKESLEQQKEQTNEN